MSSPSVILTINKNVAVISFNRPKQLNALSLDDYQLLAMLMRKAASNDDVTITVITGAGKYFSAGADVNSNRGSSPADPADEETRKFWLMKFTAGNVDVTRAFIEHPKILIAALNGPVIGLTAALISHCDFVYANESAFLMTPFASLGLVAEGASSYMFVKRMGLASANEALITSRRIPARQLLACGFVNKLFPTEDFFNEVRAHIDDTFGSHLNHDSMIRIKALIKSSYIRELESTNVIEHYGGLARFEVGIPQKAFALIASGQKKHKL